MKKKMPYAFADQILQTVENDTYLGGSALWNGNRDVQTHKYMREAAETSWILEAMRVN